MFTALLDRGAGHFGLRPAGAMVPIARRYVPGTLIIETTWVTDTGWLVVNDALTIADWESVDDERSRPKCGHEPDRSLLRVAICIDGAVDLEMECVPRFGYGAVKAAWSGGELGEAVAAGDGVRLELSSDLNLELFDGVATGRLHLRENETAFCSLTWHDGSVGGPRSAPEAHERLESTREFWREWLRHGSFPDHPWRLHLQRSALVLKGLQDASTGAGVAAATTSLPETLGGERNWDYRFNWIRDATFSLWAMHTLGFEEEAVQFMEFIMGVTRDHPDLQIMYGVGGERDLPEMTLDHLSGYEDSRPVRVGNAAVKQRQNDVWGALLDSVYLHSKALGHLSDEGWEVIETQVEAAIDAWGEPDQGIWEARSRPQHYVSSKLMMWVAVDRGRRLAAQRHERELEQRWAEIADDFRAEILERGIRDGVFRQHYDTDALDASVLLIPLVRFLRPDDERVRATVKAIDRELTVHGLVKRYHTHQTNDGLDGEEGTFLICSFWMVSALSEIGEQSAARELCERLLLMAGQLDLYAEEIDPSTMRHLGNFPQAFTHLALINAVSHVIADEIREGGGATAVFTEMGGVREDA